MSSQIWGSVANYHQTTICDINWNNFNTHFKTCLKINILRHSNSARFLEHFILNGPDPKALDAVLAQMTDPERLNPQELDQAVIGKATCRLQFSFF